jgi:hypothetical protein
MKFSAWANPRDQSYIWKACSAGTLFLPSSFRYFYCSVVEVVPPLPAVTVAPAVPEATAAETEAAVALGVVEAVAVAEVEHLRLRFSTSYW